MTNIQYFPTEFDMGDFTDEQLESILIFLQMKYGDFRDKGDFGIERFYLILETFLRNWCREVYEDIQFRKIDKKE